MEAAMRTLGDFGPDLPRPAVLATLVKIVGSAPQQAGAKMWVTAEEFFGTLGGGRFEFEVLKHARDLLKSHGAAPHLKEYVLCKEMGQCCGGRVEVFFEPVPRRKAVHLFGGGHVGRAAAQVLSGMPFAVALVDPRPEWSRPEGLPKDVRVLCADPVEYARSQAWGAEDAACVFTHSHDLDFEIVKHLLTRPLGYLGLIGSEHKADVFRARLQSGLDARQAEALEELWESKVRCPVGVPLASKHPKVIAVSIAAQLLEEWALAAPEASALEPAPNTETSG